MKGISNFFQHIATHVLVSTPCLPAFFLPLTQARNLPPVNSEPPVDDEYQTTGRALYQLAQNMTNVTAVLASCLWVKAKLCQKYTE